MSLTHSFEYEYFPRVDLLIHVPGSGMTAETEAMIDTGAEFSLFDIGLARSLEIDFAHAGTVRMEPVASDSFVAQPAMVRLSLLLVPELTLETTVLFAPNIAPIPGNLIGLDILQHFDVALFHSHRTGLIGWSQ